MSQRAKNQAACIPVSRINPSTARSTTATTRSGAQAALGVQQRGKPDFRINHAIRNELLKHILGHGRSESSVCISRKPLGRATETPPDWRSGRAQRNRVVLFASDGRRQAGNRLVAQRAVQMQMQLDFRERLESHGLKITRARCVVHRYGKSEFTMSWLDIFNAKPYGYVL